MQNKYIIEIQNAEQQMIELNLKIQTQDISIYQSKVNDERT
jgi:hypothetical protein